MSMENEVKTKCLDCGKEVILNYTGQEEWHGNCEDCGWHYSIARLDELEE